MSLSDVLKIDLYEERINSARKWVARLSADSSIPPVFVNGVAIPRGEVNYPILFNMKKLT